MSLIQELGAKGGDGATSGIEELVGMFQTEAYRLGVSHSITGTSLLPPSFPSLSPAPDDEDFDDDFDDDFEEDCCGR